MSRSTRLGQKGWSSIGIEEMGLGVIRSTSCTIYILIAARYWMPDGLLLIMGKNQIEIKLKLQESACESKLE